MLPPTETQLLLLFTLGYFFSPYININANGINCPKYCNCDRLNAMVCGGDTPPHTIPRAPPDIDDVLLLYMDLGYITREMTRNLTFCHMTSLDLFENNITGIAEDAFEAFLYLKEFYWRQDGLFPYTDFRSIFPNQGSNLTSLIVLADINYVLESAMFQGMRNLKTLVLKVRNIVAFDVSLLSTTLIDLDLSKNILVSIEGGWCLPNLRKLTLNGNRLARVPQLCTGNATSPISILYLADNVIRDLFYYELSCLNNLEKLDISGNRLDILRDNVFAYLPNLYETYISRMTILRSISEFAFNSSSLRRLVFAGNPNIMFFSNSSTLFSNTPNLKILDMTGSSLRYKQAEIFQNLKNIKKLKLRNINLNRMPSGLFQKMKHLTFLDLSSNSFPPWNKSVFENVSSIRHLVLFNSQIQVITEDSFPLEFRLNVKTIDLSDNPFRCTCDLLWFKTWMDEVIKNKSIRFRYLREYQCYKNIPVKRLKSFHPTAALCQVKDTYVKFLTTILSVVLILIVAVLVIYRYRWYILYWISLLRRRRQYDHLHVDFRYDGFVSYSNPDLDWVLEELLAFLEEEVGLKLCEHGRDFEAGKYIVDNVIESVDNSRKTILVISNEYMKSAWCQFELNMVLSSYLNNEVDIVVILLEHIEAPHVTSSLRALMMSTTYLEWSEEEEARRLFREKLKNAMIDDGV